MSTIEDVKKTIIVGARPFRMLYVLQLPCFGMVTKKWKRIPNINLKKISTVIDGIVEEKRRKQQAINYRFIPENTAYGLLWRVPEWWLLNPLRHAYNKYARLRMSRRFHQNLLKEHYTQCMRRFKKKKKQKRRFYKGRLVKNSIISLVAVLNTSSFFKKIMYDFYSGRHFRKISDLGRASFTKFCARIKSLSQAGYHAIWSIYRSIKYSSFLGTSFYSVAFISKLLILFSIKPLSMLPYLIMFNRRLLSYNRVFCRCLAFGERRYAYDVCMSVVLHVGSFFNIVRHRACFSGGTSLSLLFFRFFSPDTGKDVVRHAKSLFSVRQDVILRKIKNLVRKVFVNKQDSFRNRMGILVMRSTGYNTYLTFLLGYRVMYKKSAGMVEPNRRARKTYKVAQALSERFLLHFRRSIVRYGINQIELVSSGHRIIEKAIRRGMYRFRKAYSRLRRQALWSLIRLYRRCHRLRQFRGKFKSKAARQFLKSRRTLLRQVQHASLFRFSRRYIFVAHSKPFNGCRGRLLITDRK